jgi:hypothetical protein
MSVITLCDINNKLDIILEKLNCIDTKCQKMDSHINLIEHIYTLLRKPLNFIIGKFYKIDDLPTINNDNLYAINNNDGLAAINV